MDTTTSGPSFEIFLLGQPRFVFEGQPFRFSAPPKTLQLFAHLMLYRAAPAPREKLAFTLWEDETEEDARANLRRHLHHLSRALPAASNGLAWVIADAETVRWNPQAPARLDVAEFERLAGRAETHAEAVELYKGDLLETLYDEWLFPERDRLRNLYVAVLGELLLQCRGARDYGRAAIYAQRILANDPWREDTVRQLMAVRYESGDRAGSLDVYRQFEHRLREEMSVEPMPETIALRDIVFRNEPVPAAAIAPIAATPANAPLLPFVGRDAEMDQLRGVWSRAARGHGSVVLIGGEAGIGKSRLASEFAMLAETQGARVMTGLTAFPESAPYQALVDAFRTAAPLLASLQVQPIWLGVLAQAVPDLKVRLLQLPTPPKVAPERERVRLFEAFSTCLAALAKPRPLVLLLEDLHWAGEASIAALQFLGNRVTALPILIVATYRDEEAPRGHPLRRARRELAEAGALSTVSPRHLRRDAVEELMRRIPAIAHTGADFADALLKQSSGNPLFLNEVIRGVVEGADSGVAPPSASAQHAIATRVSRLSDASRELAEVAAIAGVGFDVDVLSDATGWPEAEIVDAVSDLIDRHIVRESGGRSGFAYAFTHQLIQGTIYASVPPDVRTRRHRRIAKILAESYPNRSGKLSAEVARHYDLGNEPELAAAASLAAATQALEVYARDDAARFLERCLTLAKNPDTRRSALLMRASIRGRRGDRAGQREDVKELTAMAAGSQDLGFKCAVLQSRITLARALGERDSESALVDEYVALAKESGNPRLRAESLIEYAAYATLTGSHGAAHEAAEGALALYSELGDATGQIEARCRLVEIVSEGGAFEMASAILADVRSSSAATRNPGMVARAIVSATHAAISEQRYVECRALALEARELFRSIGDREGEADLVARQGSAAARLSLHDEAKRCYDEALEIYDSIGKRLGYAAVLANSGIHSVRLGRLDDAERDLALGAEQFAALKDIRGVTACKLNLSFVRLVRGDPASAKAHAVEALDLARSIPHAGYEAAALGNLGAAERDLGALESAIQHMKAGLELRGRVSGSPDFADDLSHLVLAHLVAGNAAEVRPLAGALETSLEKLSPDIFMPEFAVWVAAQSFRALGDAKRARAFLTRAHEIVATRLAAIADPAHQANLLKLRVNREIQSAYERDEWPPLPRAFTVAAGSKAR